MIRSEKEKITRQMIAKINEITKIDGWNRNSRQWNVQCTLTLALKWDGPVWRYAYYMIIFGLAIWDKHSRPNQDSHILLMLESWVNPSLHLPFLQLQWVIILFYKLLIYISTGWMSANSMEGWICLVWDRCSPQGQKAV